MSESTPSPLTNVITIADDRIKNHLDRVRCAAHIQRSASVLISEAPIHRHEDVATFLKGLGNEWRLGERRATHRGQYVRRKPIPRRPSMMDPDISVTMS